jgi:hypothetical protein
MELVGNGLAGNELAGNELAGNELAVATAVCAAAGAGALLRQPETASSSDHAAMTAGRARTGRVMVNASGRKGQQWWRRKKS